jgi:hypothetical protein
VARETPAHRPPGASTRLCWPLVAVSRFTNTGASPVWPCCLKALCHAVRVGALARLQVSRLQSANVCSCASQPSALYPLVGLWGCEIPPPVLAGTVQCDLTLLTVPPDVHVERD